MIFILYVCSFQRYPSVHSLLPLEVPEHFPHASKDSVPSNSPQTSEHEHSQAAAHEGTGENYVTLIFCS